MARQVFVQLGMMSVLGISYFLLPAVILAESINFVWLGMMKEEDDHYLYGREERDPRKRKRMSEEVLHSKSTSCLIIITLFDA